MLLDELLINTTYIRDIVQCLISCMKQKALVEHSQHIHSTQQHILEYFYCVCAIM